MANDGMTCFFFFTIHDLWIVQNRLYTIISLSYNLIKSFWIELNWIELNVYISDRYAVFEQKLLCLNTYIFRIQWFYLLYRYCRSYLNILQHTVGSDKKNLVTCKFYNSQAGINLITNNFAIEKKVKFEKNSFYYSWTVVIPKKHIWSIVMYCTVCVFFNLTM